MKPTLFTGRSHTPSLNCFSKIALKLAPAVKNTPRRRPRHAPYSRQEGPATEESSHSRPHTASPRSHDTKRKRRRNEADLPVTGGCHKGELTPLNLRYIYIYIYIYIYMLAPPYGTRISPYSWWWRCFIRRFRKEIHQFLTQINQILRK